jgi:hypothetical protein
VSIHVLLTAVVTAVVGLFVMESYQTTPWLADKLMRWSVRLRYTDNPERVTIRGEELSSILEDLPTLFKLPTAGVFFLRALTYRLANHRSHGDHARLAIKRDILLVPALYFVNCFIFSAWSQLTEVTTKPWLLLMWLYGMVILIPLAWRDRAPVTIFVSQWVLTVAAWPIMPYFTPIVGIPVALYAVSVHCGRKISLLALLTSIIPMGLAAAVAFRVFFTYAQQLQSFIPNAVVLAFVTVGAWSAGRMTRADLQNIQCQTEPRAGQLSLKGRLRVKRDVALLPALYFVNCFIFSAWSQLTEVATEPWLLLVWLYGLSMLIPLAWRDGAPVTIFVSQWVLTVVAWPIMPYFTPIVGIPVALYAVSVHCGRKISLLALLTSVIPMGLAAAVTFRTYFDYAEQLQSFIPNAVVLAFVTVGAWAAGRMTRARREPGADQLSLEA